MAITILGIIEGITEFLPISSTGHLLLAEHLRWLPRQSDLFNVVIQCGAVIAVLPLFPERCRQLFLGWQDAKARDYLLKLATAFFITGVGGYLLEKKGYKLPEELMPVAVAMLVGGIGFLALEYFWLPERKTNTDITWTIAVLVGFGQLAAAVFPGLSRSGATILLMLAVGLTRSAATEFSFLVGIPTMMAAGGYKIFKAFHHPPTGGVHEDWGMVILGTLVSAVVSFIVVKWLLGFVQSHTFKVFGWYRIGLGLAILGLILF